MKRVITFLLLLISTLSIAQHGRRDGNRIGISGGVTYTSLLGTNFNMKPETGWIGGLSVRGNYYNDWSMIFGMQLTESNFTLETLNAASQKEDVRYKFTAAQVRLLLSANLIKNHFSIDFGPVLQVNDKLKIDKSAESNVLFVGDNTTTIQAIDVVNITKINGNIYLGVSAGTRRVRAVVFYQYGLNNVWNRLNQDQVLALKNNNKDFKAHLGILSGQVLINL